MLMGRLAAASGAYVMWITCHMAHCLLLYICRSYPHMCHLIKTPLLSFFKSCRTKNLDVGFEQIIDHIAKIGFEHKAKLESIKLAIIEYIVIKLAVIHGILSLVKHWYLF